MKSQRGIALITAIILVALATLIATAISFGSALTARRASANFTATQALYVSQGAEALAGYALREDQKDNRHDSLEETWAQPYGPVEFDEGVVLEASLEDMHARFNVNNLVDPATGVADPIAREQFERLLTLLGMEAKWAQLLIDWIDRDNQPTFPDGGEDSAYLAQTPPYRTPNMPVSSITELLALPGFGRENYLKLLPYVSALPPGSTVNPCTASGLVLDAMGPGKQEFSLDEEGLATKRKVGCFPTMAEYQATMTTEQWNRLMNMGGTGNRAGDSSFYFRLRSYITIGTTRLTLYSLILRDPGGQIRPILRTFGTD